MSFSGGLLGLGRTATAPVLTLTRQLAVVFGTVLLVCRPPTFPPKCHGGGALLSCPSSRTAKKDSLSLPIRSTVLKQLPCDLSNLSGFGEKGILTRSSFPVSLP